MPPPLQSRGVPAELLSPAATETIRGLNNHGPAIISTGVVFTVLAVTAGGLRLIAKRITNPRLGFDDWLLLASLPLFVTTEILVIRSDIVGREGVSANDGRYLTYLQYVYIYSIFYFPIIALTQASILLFYRHIFFACHIHYTSVILAIICAAWCIAALIIEIGYPGHRIADYFPGSSSITFDVTYLSFWLALAIIETVIEIIIMILPIYEILHLQLSKKKKFLVSLIFLLGSFVILTSIVRMATLYRPGRMVFDLSQGDIWLNVHLGTAIISACLPTFAPLRHIFHPRQSSYDINETSALSADKKRIGPLDSHRAVEKIYMAQRNNHQGNFVDARHSDPSMVSDNLHDDAVESGTAISVRQTVDVA